MQVDIARLAAFHEKAAEQQWVAVEDFSISSTIGLPLCSRWKKLIEIESSTYSAINKFQR